MNEKNICITKIKCLRITPYLVKFFDYREYLKGKKISTEYNLKLYNKVFIAPDAEVFQSIKMEANSSIWFSVNIFSSKKNGKIILGEGSNIQDNSIINTLGEEIVIEKRVTIGHNVILLGSQNIKNDAVIGMGSILESNCIIGNNSFIGANSYVKSGTIVPDNTIVGNQLNILEKLIKMKVYFSNKDKRFMKTLHKSTINFYLIIFAKNYIVHLVYSTMVDLKRTLNLSHLSKLICAVETNNNNIQLSY